MRQIHALSRVFLYSLVANRADYANHRMPRFVVFRWPQPNTLSDGILIGPVLACEPFIHDRYERRAFGVGVAEIATVNQRYSHRAKVTGSDNRMLNHRRLADRQYGITLDSQAPPPPTSAQRQRGRRAHRFNARQNTHTLDQLFEECRA